MSTTNATQQRRRYTPLSLLAFEKGMTGKALLKVLQAAGVTCFRLGDSWQVCEDEYDAYQDRRADEVRQARANQ